MQKVVLLGTGNLATHLFEAFTRSKNTKVIQVFSRSAEGLKAFENQTKTTQEPDQIALGDIYIIAVSDDAIPYVAQYIKNKNSIIAHCSGAMPLDILPEGYQRGVFYPLQSFTKGRKINFSRVPVCVEGETKKVQSELMTLGTAISNNCVAIDSAQRLALHLAAVYTNNFTNHLLYRASKICEANKLSFSLLQPLLMETVQKLDGLTPYEAQTGPARRRDVLTEKKHLEILNNERDQEIYTLLSKAIRETYGDEL